MADDLKSAIKDLASLGSIIRGMAKDLRDFGSAAKSAVKSVRSSSGPGNTSMFGDSLARFSNMSTKEYTATSNLIYGGMAKFGYTGGVGGAAVSMATAAVGNAPKVLGGIGNLMPDVGATYNRATDYYNAIMAQGNQYGRASFEKATLRGLGKGGLSGPGSDAMVATTLSGMGVSFSKSYGSTYQRDLRFVGNMARFYNVDNQTAAGAIGSLYSGAGSSNLLRNFGVLTSDPRTGKQLGPGQIISQITSRLTAGRGKFSKQDVLNSLNRGALGVSLQNSGLDPVMQQQVVQALLAQAEGKKYDPTSAKAMKALNGNTGNRNPTDAARNLYSAQTKAMGSAESQYLGGINAASEALQHLTKVGGDLASVFGSLKSAAATWNGQPVGQGANAIIGGAMGIAGAGLAAKYGPAALKAGANLLGNPATKNLFAGAGKAVGAVGGALKGVLSSPKGAGLASAAVGALSLGIDQATGNGWGTKKFSGDMGGAIGGTLGAVVGSFAGPVGTIVGGTIGGMIGQGIGGMFGVGGGDSSATTGSSNTKKAFKLYRPVQSNVKVTAVFGQKTYNGQTIWPNGHNGIDYPVPEGTTVLAACDGKVIAVNADYNGELGLHIYIEHPDSPSGKYTTVYCHLSKANVSEGQQVSVGTPIGLSGKTGTKITGAHLHFGLNKGNSTASATDPAPYMVDSIPPLNPQDSQATSPGTSGAAASGTTGNAGSPTSNPTGGPVAQVGSSAVGVGVSGISGSSASIASQINGSGGQGSMSTSSNGTGVGGGNSSAGLSGASSAPAVGSSISLGGGGSRDKPNVTIHLSIAQASEGEARHFAKRVKEILEEDNALSRMGRL